MVIKKVNLDIVIGVTSAIPDTEFPEVAFAGKSNVGKSSLINGLLNRKSLARTSASPGKTQTINFYNINKNLYFVDLPGYGYAKVSQEIRNKWGKMIERYLHADVLRLGKAKNDKNRDVRWAWEADEAKQLADKAMAKAEREPAGQRHEALMKQAVTARWMLEEFYVSLWAQELGTPKPISLQRIKKALS